MKILSKITWENLKKNKTRTLVTIIGIMLSVSLFTAVMSSISSANNYIVEIIKEENGDYHGKAFQMQSKDLEEIIKAPEVKSMKKLQNIGYAKIEGIQNEYKPYFFVGAMDEQFTKEMPVKIKQGRLPKNNTELIIPEHVRNNGGVTFKVGEVLTLALGERQYEDEILTQQNPFILQEGGVSEEFLPKENRTYTVVGVYERPNFEDLSSPGYTALTLGDGAGPDSFDVFIELKEVSQTREFMATNFSIDQVGYNSALLQVSGNSANENLNAVMYSLAFILSLLIMFGSVSLIYNSFSISISERSKQFGLLKSMGATKKQILKSVVMEGLMLSVIGIPLGLLLGLTGIGITFRLSRNLFSDLADIGSEVLISLKIDPIALLIASTLGLITVLISAYIPARKAAKVSVIDSLRQTDDIKVSPRKVKTNPLMYKIFGFEGMLASKNFKRNRRKYRATVISLFMSVVLFISASSFTSYLQKSITAVSSETPYDIQYTYIPDDLHSLADMENLLLQAKGIESYSVSQMANHSVIIPKKELDEGYKNDLESNRVLESQYPDRAYYRFFLDFIFVNDDYFKELVLENNVVFQDEEVMTGVYYNQLERYDMNEGRYLTGKFLKETEPIEGIQLRLKEFEGQYFTGLIEEGKYLYQHIEEDKDFFYMAEEVENRASFIIGKSLSTIPLVPYVRHREDLKVIYPYSQKEVVLGGYSGQQYNYDRFEFVFKTKESAKTYDDMVTLLENEGLSTLRLQDFRANVKVERAMASIVNIFSFGFIILISLIAGANVFNTISTNIHLRRREFAMLKSVGMTKKGFNKMMVFESILYGVKGILYGIPVALGVTYWIHRSVLQGIDTQFYIPITSILISILSVFIVVFATSIFSMDKIKKDNPIDALKNENL